MQGTQLSFFNDEEGFSSTTRPKTPKLGRYERIKRELEQKDTDPYKIFIDVETATTPASQYTFVDLFCGAGGITQGLVQAGFKALASVEMNPIASATHQRNFPDCHHFCGDIEQFHAKSWLQQISSPEINLVVGGPPCQGFSVAGKRDPKDPRKIFWAKESGILEAELAD